MCVCSEVVNKPKKSVHHRGDAVEDDLKNETADNASTL